jgi:hypothetical protein
MRLDREHGSPYDRGSADSYYRRPFRPHYFVGATYSSKEVVGSEMSAAEIAEYKKGFNDNEENRNFKEWG